jgi:hypothetical protein
MDRGDVEELHYIVLFENIPSILERGILSRRRAAQLNPESIANEEILARRASTRVPRGRLLSYYANLYFDARNAMLSRRRARWRDIGVIRVSDEVLDLPGAVVADRNAAATAARFFPSPEGIAHLDRNAVFAEWWTESREARQLRMAELLIPDLVPPHFLTGIYVMDSECARRLGRNVAIEHVTVNRYLYFQEGRHDR